MVGGSDGGVTGVGGGAGEDGESGERDGGGDGVTQGPSSMLSIPSGEVRKIGRRMGRLALKREERVERRWLRNAVASGDGSGSGSGAIEMVVIVCDRKGCYSCGSGWGKKGSGEGAKGRVMTCWGD